ncbi:hypothetical protein GE061_019122 [Apolygus lucorum]|uniref:asparaginase n=1 Tax=Apolygus lucorum TaxID=248454 RepID=A0A6A4JEY1_APOLU|nr:hypothetical protein GE061_019122 [Apolygus lucorum]
MASCKPLKFVKPPKEDMKRVLVLYFSGCIGFINDFNQTTEGLPTTDTKLYDFCRTDPTLNDINFLGPSLESPAFCVLPADQDQKMDRVAYLVHPYDKLMDSCNVCPAHWKTIAKDIQANYEDFDGFVLLHGNDTMAYTASALSFMLENLSKCLVITGSIKPIFDIRSDAKSNMKTAILIAGNYQIPEVTIFFRDRLLRGNRCIKRGADSFFAFDSLNVPPLLQMGFPMKEVDNLIKTPTKRCKLKIHAKLNPNVSFLRIYPGLPIQIMKACFEVPIDGVVMQTYGLGNVPYDRTELIKLIKEAIDRGVIIVNCTQCPTGAVMPVSIVGNGTLLEEMGVIFVSDMTAEAAITKVMYVLSKKKLSLEEKKRMMSKSIRGEMTERGSS